MPHHRFIDLLLRKAATVNRWFGGVRTRHVYLLLTEPIGFTRNFTASKKPYSQVLLLLVSKLTSRYNIYGFGIGIPILASPA